MQLDGDVERWKLNHIDRIHNLRNLIIHPSSVNTYVSGGREGGGPAGRMMGLWDYSRCREARGGLNCRMRTSCHAWDSLTKASHRQKTPLPPNISTSAAVSKKSMSASIHSIAWSSPARLGKEGKPKPKNLGNLLSLRIGKARKQGC